MLWKISTAAVAASVLETSAFPKPGNVHPLRNYKDLRYEHMLVAGSGIGKGAYEAAKLGKGKGLGKIIADTVEYCNSLHKGTNPNMGIILMLLPLSAAASSGKDLRKELRRVLKEMDYRDTLNILKAIKSSRAVLTVEGENYSGELDILRASTEKEIKKGRITPLQLFNLSQRYDRLSEEWVTGYEIVFSKIGFFEKQLKYGLNTAIVNTFLKMLSEYPDTLVSRKAGSRVSKQVSKMAKDALKRGGLSSKEGTQDVCYLDAWLGKRNLNPGTTADLIASILFIKLVLGFRP